MPTVPSQTIVTDSDFTTLAHQYQAGYVLAWQDYMDAQHSGISYALASWVPAATWGNGESTILKYNGDFLTKHSVPIGANIDYIKPFMNVSGGGIYSEVHGSINGTTVAQYTISPFNEPARNKVGIFPGGGTDTDWGLSQANMRLFLDGTNDFRFWCEQKDDTYVMSVKAYYCQLTFAYSVDVTLPATEGAIVLSDFD